MTVAAASLNSYHPPHDDPCYDAITSDVLTFFVKRQPYFHHPQALKSSSSSISTAEHASGAASDAAAANPAGSSAICDHYDGITRLIKKAFVKRRREGVAVGSDLASLSLPPPPEIGMEWNDYLETVNMFEAAAAAADGEKFEDIPTSSVCNASAFSTTRTFLFPNANTATALVLFLAQSTNAIDAVRFLVETCGANLEGRYTYHQPSSLHGKGKGEEGSANNKDGLEAGGFLVRTAIYVDARGIITPSPAAAAAGDKGGGTVTSLQPTIIRPGTRAMKKRMLSSVSLASALEHEAVVMAGGGSSSEGGDANAKAVESNPTQLYASTPLHFAAKMGRVEMCQTLLDLYAMDRMHAEEDTNRFTSVKPSEMLMEAAKGARSAAAAPSPDDAHQQQCRVSRMIQFINMKDAAYGRTCFQYACRSGGYRTVSLMLGIGHGAEVNRAATRSFSDGNARDDSAAVARLSELPTSARNVSSPPLPPPPSHFWIDVNGRDKAQEATAMHDACSQGKLSTVLRLIGRACQLEGGGVHCDGGDEEQQRQQQHYHPLASAGIADAQGNTALHTACRYMGRVPGLWSVGDSEEEEEKEEEEEEEDGTPKENAKRAFLSLLDASVMPYFIKAEPQNALDDVSNPLPPSPPFFSLVSQGGRGLNARNNNGQTPLHIAVSEGSLNAVKALLDYSKSPAPTTGDGGGGGRLQSNALSQQSLRCAVCEGERMLWSSSVEGNHSLTDAEREALLLQFQKTNQSAITTTATAEASTSADAIADVVSASSPPPFKVMCPRCHSDVDALDKQGRTALHYACMDRYPSLPCVQLLLGHGASVSIRDKKGLTPLQCVVKYAREPSSVALGRTNGGDGDGDGADAPPPRPTTVLGALLDQGAV